MMQKRRDSLVEGRAVPWITVALAFSALCVAWLAQYGGGLAPCHLCYLQRYAYWAAIAVGFVAVRYSYEPKPRRIWLILTGIALLTVAGIALFHVGVEQGWWAGSEACVGETGAGQSVEDLTTSIMNAPVVRCDEPAFVLFGISMAGYNVLYSLALAAFAFWGATRTSNR